MKKILFVMCLGLITADTIDVTDENAAISYTLAQKCIKNILKNNIDLDKEAFLEGVEDAINGTNVIPKEDRAEIHSKIKGYVKENSAKKLAKLKALKKSMAKANLAAEKKFIQEYKEKPNVIATESGILYEVITNGSSNTKPTVNSVVKVDYVGRLIDGKVFDRSKADVPAKLKIAKTIKGWQEIIPMMAIGDEFKVIIPSELAYGENGLEVLSPSYASIIPPNSPLVFNIKLVDIVD